MHMARPSSCPPSSPRAGCQHQAYYRCIAQLEGRSLQNPKIQRVWAILLREGVETTYMYPKVAYGSLCREREIKVDNSIDLCEPVGKITFAVILCYTKRLLFKEL